MFCDRNQLGKNTLSSALEYDMANNHEKNELPSIIYAIHLIETNTSVYPFAKKRKINTDLVVEKMNHISERYRIKEDDPSMSREENEWIQSLYDEILHKANTAPKKVLVRIRHEIERFVKSKPEALFYNSSVLATIFLIKYDLPIDHKLPSSKIRKIMKELFV